MIVLGEPYVSRVIILAEDISVHTRRVENERDPGRFIFGRVGYHPRCGLVLIGLE